MKPVECRRAGHHLREQGISAWDYGERVMYGLQTFCDECQNVTLSPPTTSEETRMIEGRIRQDAEEEEIFLTQQESQPEES